MDFSISASADVIYDLTFTYSKIIDIRSVLIQPSGNIIHCPYYYNSVDYNLFFIRPNGKVQIRCGASYGCGNMSIVFDYIKD